MFIDNNVMKFACAICGLHSFRTTDPGRDQSKAGYNYLFVFKAKDGDQQHTCLIEHQHESSF